MYLFLSHLCHNEAILSHQLEPDLIRDHAAVAVGDVGKWSGMHQYRRALQGLQAAQSQHHMNVPTHMFKVVVLCTTTC